MQRIPDVLIDKLFYINKFKDFKFELYKQVKLTTDYSGVPSDEIGEALVTINLADKEIWADLLIKEESIKRVSGYYPHLVLEDTTKVESKKSLTIRAVTLCSWPVADNLEPLESPLKNIGKLIAPSFSVSPDFFKNVSPDVPVYKFSTLEEAKALLELDNVRVVNESNEIGYLRIWKEADGIIFRGEFKCKIEKNKSIECEGFSPELEEFITKHLEILKSCLSEYFKILKSFLSEYFKRKYVEDRKFSYKKDIFY